MFGVYLRRERLAQLPQTVKYSVVHLGKSFPSKIYPKHETKLRSRSPPNSLTVWGSGVLGLDDHPVITLVDFLSSCLFLFSFISKRRIKENKNKQEERKSTRVITG
jgi:hypothetical protein